MDRVPGNVRLNQARCLKGNKVKNFGKHNTINIVKAPANNPRAIGLVQSLIQTTKSR